MDREKHIADLGKMIADRVEQARLNIIQRHTAAGQKASGRTIASMYTEAVETGTSVTVTLYGRKFFQGLETGRKGGKVPKGFYHIIKQWAIDKHLTFANNRELCTFSYFVAKKIASNGTKLFRNGGRNDIYSPEIQAAQKDIRGMITWFMNEEMQSIQLN